MNKLSEVDIYNKPISADEDNKCSKPTNTSEDNKYNEPISTNEDIKCNEENKCNETFNTNEDNKQEQTNNRDYKKDEPSEPNGKITIDTIKDNTEDKKIIKVLNNFIYSSGEISLQDIPQSWNNIHFYVIYPCTAFHIKKYSYTPKHIVYESAKCYKDIHVPYTKNTLASINWIDNILSYTNEGERIVFEDIDLDNGYVIVPDLNWAEKDIKYSMIDSIQELPTVFCKSIVQKFTSFRMAIKSTTDTTNIPSLFISIDSATKACDKYYLHNLKDIIKEYSLPNPFIEGTTNNFIEDKNLRYLCIVRRKDLYSIRDLRQEHLPLLENIQLIVKLIAIRHNIPESFLVPFFHYPPSFYHLHIHIHTLNTLLQQNPIRIHLLNSVITNIRNCDTYY